MDVNNKVKALLYGIEAKVGKQIQWWPLETSKIRHVGIVALLPSGEEHSRIFDLSDGLTRRAEDEIRRWLEPLVHCR